MGKAGWMKACAAADGSPLGEKGLARTSPNINFNQASHSMLHHRKEKDEARPRHGLHLQSHSPIPLDESTSPTKIQRQEKPAHPSSLHETTTSTHHQPTSVQFNSITSPAPPTYHRTTIPHQPSSVKTRQDKTTKKHPTAPYYTPAQPPGAPGESYQKKSAENGVRYVTLRNRG